MQIRRRQNGKWNGSARRLGARGSIAGLVAIVLASGVVDARAAGGAKLPAIPLAASRMIIEFNASAEDIGVQLFLDQSSGWKEIVILDPLGREIFGAEAEGRLIRQGGGTELFLESVEPPLEDLPLDVFFRRFPEGVYRFRGRTVDGERLVGAANFSHDVPEGPVVVTPDGGAEGCGVDVPLAAVISWEPVTTSISGEPIEITKYEVIVENADRTLNFDVTAPASVGTTVTLPPEILEPGTDYIFEVLAIEAGGNQTITEGCFTSAN